MADKTLESTAADTTHADTSTPQSLTTAIKAAQSSTAATTESPAAPVGPVGPVFKDTAYKSRTLILDDGRAFSVEKGRIVANDPALRAYLEQHPQFVRED